MLPAFEKIMFVVQPIALAVMLIYTYGLFCRSIKNPHVLRATMGALFGIAAAMAMATPIPIADGIIIDIRNLFIGVAAAFFGVLGGVIALLAGIALRISIGGDGTILGIAGMITAALMGALWALYVHPRMKQELTGQLVLAGMISQHLVLAVFLPTDIRGNFLTDLAPILLIANLIGTLLLGQMIRREHAMLEETDRLLTEVATDPLTKLVNRKSAAATFATLPALHNPNLGQAMLCIDVDGFKGINDTHGHICGDNILVIISDRLTACLRPDDIFSRISGDEFLIVLHGITSEQAKAVAERARAAIGDDQLVVDGVILSASISIGAVWTRKLSTFKTLRARADDALYRAKATGRNCVSFEIDQIDEQIVAAAVA